MVSRPRDVGMMPLTGHPHSLLQERSAKSRADFQALTICRMVTPTASRRVAPDQNIGTMRSSKSRSRNKSRNPRSLGNVINRVFDSSGPEGKVRGTPQQIIEKYLALARDAQLSNDRVAEQSFLQHAEHYTRLLGEAQREQAERQAQFGGPQGGQGGDVRDDRGEGRGEARGDGRSDNRSDSRRDDRRDDRGDRQERRDDRGENRHDRRDDRPRDDRPAAQNHEQATQVNGAEPSELEDLSRFVRPVAQGLPEARPQAGETDRITTPETEAQEDAAPEAAAPEAAETAAPAEKPAAAPPRPRKPRAASTSAAAPKRAAPRRRRSDADGEGEAEAVAKPAPGAKAED